MILVQCYHDGGDGNIAVIARVDRSATIKKQRDDLSVPALSRDEERGSTVVRSLVYGRPATQQGLRHRQMTSIRRNEERSFAVVHGLVHGRPAA